MNHNEQVLRNWIEAGDRGELEKFDDCLDKNVIIHAPFGLSTDGVEKEKSVWREAKQKMPNIHHDIQDVVSSGATAAARIIVTGTLTGEFGGISASGKSFQIDQVIYAYFKNGKIIEAWEIVDTASLLQQLEQKI